MGECSSIASGEDELQIPGTKRRIKAFDEGKLGHRNRCCEVITLADGRSEARAVRLNGKISGLSIGPSD